MEHETLGRADVANRRVGRASGLSPSHSFRLPRAPFAKSAALPVISSGLYPSQGVEQILTQVIENKGWRPLQGVTRFEGADSLLGYHGAGKSPARSRNSGSEN